MSPGVIMLKGDGKWLCAKPPILAVGMATDAYGALGADCKDIVCCICILCTVLKLFNTVGGWGDCARDFLPCCGYAARFLVSI